MSKLKQDSFVNCKRKSDFKYTKCLFRNREFKDYTAIRSVNHKNFSNRQERSKAILDILEYGKEFGLRIRAKRCNSLPEPYDDYPSFVYDQLDSWKFYSKRKNQYK